MFLKFNRFYQTVIDQLKVPGFIEKKIQMALSQPKMFCAEAFEDSSLMLERVIFFFRAEATSTKKNRHCKSEWAGQKV